MSTASSGNPFRTVGNRQMPDNWLLSPDPWEVARPNEKVEVSLGCSVELSGGSLCAGLYSGAYAGLGYQP